MVVGNGFIRSADGMHKCISYDLTHKSEFVYHTTKRLRQMPQPFFIGDYLAYLPGFLFLVNISTTNAAALINIRLPSAMMGKSSPVTGVSGFS